VSSLKFDLSHVDLHQLNPPKDRNAYLDALNTFYRVGLEEGRERYGPRFCNNPFLTAAHNSHKVRATLVAC
jgi:hypothetical protein